MRPKILVSAYGCEPNKGSEQGVGWNWVMEMSEISDLVVVTRSNNRESIEAELESKVCNNVRFIYYDLSRAILRMKHREKGLYGYYLFWQWGAYQLAKKLVQRESFDYVMHLSFGSIWLPTFMHRLPLPFIWGPIGGGEAVPWQLIRCLPMKARLPQYMRHLLMASFRYNALYTGITRRAKVILARTNDTARLFSPSYTAKVHTILETAIAEDLIESGLCEKLPKSGSHKIRVIFTGRLVGLKNVDMAIAAVARSRKQGANITFTIIGEGPLRAKLESSTRRHGVSDIVTFKGKLSQREVLMELSKSDIYLFPSLKEGGAWSLMEAMAIGLPVICVETSGMAIITDDESAFRIQPGSPETMVKDFAEALLSLANSASLRQTMGAKSKERIEKHYRWHHKRKFMQELFDRMSRKTE